MLWQVVTAAGSGLALTLIVAIAVGVFALTGLYVASAVAVLERFAQRAESKGVTAAFVLGMALVASALVPRLQSPAIANASLEEWLSAYVGVAPIVCALAVAAAGCCWLAVHSARAIRLGAAALKILGLGFALWLGSTGQPSLAAAPATCLAILCIVIALARRRAAPGKASPAGELERELRWVTGALALASVLAVAHPEPSPALAAIAEWIFLTFFGAVVLGLAPLAAAGLLQTRRSAEWFIAVRYLVARRRQVFISAITAICVGGIAAGVWLIIIVLSVMNGFERTWREEILGNRAHFTVNSEEEEIRDYESVLALVRATPGVVAATPYLDADGMVRGAGGEILSVKVRGIDPATIGDVTDLPEDIILGSVAALGAPDGSGETGPSVPPPSSIPQAPIVIGNQLAISVGAAIGDSLLLISPYGGPRTPLGPAPRLVRFRVAGIYQTSFFQYDEVYTYVTLAAAQAFRDVGDVVDGIEVRSTDFYRSRALGDAVAEQLGEPFFARDWKEFFPAFFQALRTERVMMFVLLMMIMVVAAFLIVATLVMMIMEKSSDIAILKAMGAEDETIERIFAIEGTLIGLAGTTLGVLAGVAVTGQLDWIQARIETLTGVDALSPSIYQFSTLPSEVDPVQVAIVTAIAMILALGATLLPSRQGARLDPAEGLRYE